MPARGEQALERALAPSRGRRVFWSLGHLCDHTPFDQLYALVLTDGSIRNHLIILVNRQ
jgi:hypothetical protein